MTEYHHTGRIWIFWHTVSLDTFHWWCSFSSPPL